ncbi:MAG: hypothetical protein ACRYF0_00110 [Janthinobacterium lividum]
MKTPKLVATAALFLAAGHSLFGQGKPMPNGLRRPGETTVFSFRTSRGKVASLCEGPKAAYLVYRFGTASKVELQYPAVLDTSSWRKFTYHKHYYDGTNNASEDVNQLSFTIGTVEYMLFDNRYGFLDEYKQNDHHRKIGIDVSMKGVRISGSEDSANGNLYLTDDQRARVKLSEQP